MSVSSADFSCHDVNTMQELCSDLQTLGDAVRCLALVDAYRRSVESGELCGGDCPEEGAGCQSGVCRARLRYVKSENYH